MFLFGKRPGRPEVVAASVGHTACLFVRDTLSGGRFLVDSGWDISTFPASIQDRKSGITEPSCTAANGSSINIYGKRVMSIQFGNHRFTWTFFIADIPQPLIGADFLASYDLLVDNRRRRLVDGKRLNAISAEVSTEKSYGLNAVSQLDNPYSKIIQEFPAIN